ncbi:MAG: DNA-binding protein [Candidatus Omnitrophica bacterium]|nr:DNA-binding protein [Candidatus Omnitrophota bacterium]
MRKVLLYQLALIIPAVLFSLQCYAQDIPSTELIKNAKLYDGKIVTYGGEAVGDIMVRGEFAWVNIYDGSNAIGIWVHKDLIRDITYTGGYRAKGDLVAVAGRFNRSCLEHGGDLDIHAQSFTKISPGSKIHHALDTEAVKSASVLFCTLVLIFLLRMRQSRKPASSRHP